MVPLRKIFETLGATVVWEDSSQTITATRGERTVVLEVNKSEALVDGAVSTLDAPPLILDGRTMVPVRFVSESLGATVEWEEDTNTVFITQ